MGTRNLTVVIHNETPKIAQYGQWDGMPGGQGLTALQFCHDLVASDIRDKFIAQLNKIKFVTDEQIKELYASLGVHGKFMTESSFRQFNNKYPNFSRDNAAKILNIVLNSEDEEILLQDYFEFASSSLFCEWAYVIDLDKNTFEVYKGFNDKNPLRCIEHDDCINNKEMAKECFVKAGGKLERFADLDWEKEYYPVKLAAEFSLLNIPTEEEFLEYFREEDD